MKWMVLLMLVLPVWAAEVEGTIWYNAEGQVAVVEGPAAEPAPVPFVPEWRKREIARQERSHGARDGTYYGGYWGGGFYRSYQRYRVHRSRGWCLPRAVPYRGGFYGAYCGSRGSGATIIIRR